MLGPIDKFCQPRIVIFFTSFEIRSDVRQSSEVLAQFRVYLDSDGEWHRDSCRLFLDASPAGLRPSR
jgi:hypothetical protein